MWDLDEDSFITLEDENGNEVDFLLLDVFEFDGSDYMALLPLTDEDEEDEDVEEELFFLRCEKTEDGETYAAIRSQLELDQVTEAFETYCTEREKARAACEFGEDQGN